MMKHRKFMLACLLATLVNLLLNAGAYFMVLKEFYRAHPGFSAEFQQQLARQPDQIIGWALAVSAVTMGVLIATVMKWSGARSFSSGLRYGCTLAALFWSSINFGLYASSHHFSQASLFVDLACSVTAMTLSGAVAAWMLGAGQAGAAAANLSARS